MKRFANNPTQCSHVLINSHPGRDHAFRPSPKRIHGQSPNTYNFPPSGTRWRGWQNMDQDVEKEETKPRMCTTTRGAPKRYHKFPELSGSMVPRCFGVSVCPTMPSRLSFGARYTWMLRHILDIGYKHWRRQLAML